MVEGSLLPDVGNLVIQFRLLDYENAAHTATNQLSLQLFFRPLMLWLLSASSTTNLRELQLILIVDQVAVSTTRPCLDMSSASDFIAADGLQHVGTQPVAVVNKLLACIRNTCMPVNMCCINTFI